MPPQVNQTKPLTTVSGKFYVGMTAQDAKKNDLYKSSFSRDFRDIDKNGNNVLEDWEICAERDSECSVNNTARSAALIGGIGVCVAAVLASPFTGGTSLLALPAGITAIGFGGYGVVSTSKENEVTKEYRKQHNLDKTM